MGRALRNGLPQGRALSGCRSLSAFVSTTWAAQACPRVQCHTSAHLLAKRTGRHTVASNLLMPSPSGSHPNHHHGKFPFLGQHPHTTIMFMLPVLFAGTPLFAWKNCLVFILLATILPSRNLQHLVCDMHGHKCGALPLVHHHAQWQTRVCTMHVCSKGHLADMASQMAIPPGASNTCSPGPSF